AQHVHARGSGDGLHGADGRGAGERRGTRFEGNYGMKVKGLLLVTLALAAAMAVFALWVAAGLPEGAELPTHWNAAGEVDDTMPALLALLFPAGMTVLLGLLFAAIPSLEPLQHKLEGSAPVLRVSWIATLGLMVFVQAMIAGPAFGWRLGPQL